MAYKYQSGAAQMSGALTQEGAFKLHNEAGSEVASVLQSGIVSGSAVGMFSALAIDSVQVFSDAQQLQNVASLDATTEATVEAAIDTLANLASMGASGNELEALGVLDVAEGIKVANSEVISSARAVANITSVDGSGDLTMGTITMTGFSVDADGDTALKSLAVDNSSTIGCDADADIMTLAAQSLALASDVDFNVAKTAGLQLGGVAVSSTAAELNKLDGAGADVTAAKLTSLSALSDTEIGYVDGSSAGTVVASKAVVVDANKDIDGYRSLTASANVVAAKFFGDGAGITNINVGNLDAFGSDKQIQFNQNGEFSANAGLIYDGSGSFAISGSDSGMQNSEIYFGAPSSKQAQIYVDEDDGYALSIFAEGTVDLSGSDGITAMMGNGLYLNVASEFENSGLKLVDYTGATHVQLKRDGSVSGSAIGAFAGLAIDSVQVFSDAQQLMNVASLDATTEATVEAAIDTLANLASMGSNGSELEALGSLDVAQGLKIANTEAISTARAGSLSSLAVDDLTDGRVLLAGASGEVEDSSKLTFNAGTGALSVAGAVSGSGNFSIGGTLSADNLANATVDLTADMMVIDDGASGAIKITSLAAYASALAGQANEGLSSTAGRLAVDLNDLSTDTALTSGGGDSLAFVDSGDSDATKNITVSNFLGSIAGAGISVSSGKLVADSAAAPNAIGDEAATLAEGFNYGSATLTSARVWSLPAPQEVGDIVHVKAPANASSTLTITVSGGTIDGASSVVLESPYAAVSLICIDVGSDLWRLY